MEDHTNFLLDWSYICRGKSKTEELTESLLITTMELESARFKAQEQLKIKEDEVNELKKLLNITINEKNEAENRYRALILEHHKNAIFSSVEDEPVINNGPSSSDCEESIVSSSVADPKIQFEQDFGIPVKVLPEQGKLLEAVMKAGPLLQSLLLAGPMPDWRHPPPALDGCRIPPPPVAPAAVERLVWKKRGNPEGSDSSTETKYQRININ